MGDAFAALENNTKKSLEKQQTSVDAANVLLESLGASAGDEMDEEIAEILKVAEEAAALTGTAENDDDDSIQE